MKIIDRYILTTYLSRLLSVFFILMLIFIIQTFWLFIDEIAGKGLDTEIILKFLAYYSPKLYPLVMPLSVLLASIMTFGSLAENYEFAAMKSTGISLQRALLGLVVFHFFLGVGSFYFSNHVIPLGEFKYYNLRRNLAKVKPALAITEGIFNDIGEMNIKVKRKYGENDRFLEDIIIHEKTPDRKNNIVIKAASGELKSATIGLELQLHLFDGFRYEDIQVEKNADKEKMPHAKVSFKKYIMNIDLSQFNDVDFGEEKYTSTFRMQKVQELSTSIDTLERDYLREKSTYSDNFNKTSYFSRLAKEKKRNFVLTDSLILQSSNPLVYVTDGFKSNQTQILRTAKMDVGTMIRNLNQRKRTFFIYQKLINLHKNTFWEKHTLGFGIFFLFLIGASLGAIIRKGGLGLPMVLAILIFLSYHYVSLFGKNAAEDSSVSPFIGSWLSVFIIAPFAIYFTYRASTDRGLMNADYLIVSLKSLSTQIKNSIFALRNKKA